MKGTSEQWLRLNGKERSRGMGQKRASRVQKVARMSTLEQMQEKECIYQRRHSHLIFELLSRLLT
ncbi:hypothetical protein HBI56_161750 [Parastagonospora nodorum]|uniref:Uncharacterized protein n=1 Tax=Phaeosphaeria nodorum (strain SN15 / ATCC MYA-4574 / FGSC 10173) TaxID=321614 RepID=A0A7U2NPS0_PHANO|nr:hypothetical protein HBH56_210890 [Parastagonospora nodorum]QRD05970.1 hypothetical protein JI435_445110 [Parastagonospora nodorum SN15]KAH3931505.1 hypothetical protein HBH54_099500 [Parastagonospora nodorum]KAH3960713.1 hypothetical protein HBH51_189250 [Parastagonospora nodorum]KAH3994404.1 hypothetical protein HBI10_186500 [Parastagonospora nodorum]